MSQHLNVKRRDETGGHHVYIYMKLTYFPRHYSDYELFSVLKTISKRRFPSYASGVWPDLYRTREVLKLAVTHSAFEARPAVTVLCRCWAPSFRVWSVSYTAHTRLILFPNFSAAASAGMYVTSGRATNAPKVIEISRTYSGLLRRCTVHGRPLLKIKHGMVSRDQHRTVIRWNFTKFKHFPAKTRVERKCYRFAIESTSKG